MARAVISDSKRRPQCEPLYDMDPQTGASVEVFFADRVLAESFGRGTGWFWWTCQHGSLPDGLPTGPFATSYAAFRDALLSSNSTAQRFGKRITAVGAIAEGAGQESLRTRRQESVPGLASRSRAIAAALTARERIAERAC